MPEDKYKIRYFVYARKSTESDDRQIQSIDDQVNRLKQLAKELDLKIVKVFTESKSAKKPKNRPIFDEMIERIEAGEADGILCWKIDRISRNPFDSGAIQWLLQQGILKSIRTIEREYLPDDNALLLNVESGVANQFILDLRKNVKRGLQSKLEKGIFPNLAPLGYINSKTEEKGHNYIKPDPERFNLVKKMWQLMITGNFTPMQILNEANNTWGFRTRKSKRLGGEKLSRTGLYRMLNNPFYTGLLIVRGKNYGMGKHEPMITLEEFDRVQYLLGKKGKQRPKVRQFPFTGVIRCNECGCLITAEIKTKFIKGAGELKEYTYYHCTKKRTDIKCSQSKVIRAENLDSLIEELIVLTDIIPDFRELAFEELKKSNAKEVHIRTNIQEMQMKAFQDTQKQIDKLLEMKLKEQITDEEYNTKRDLLMKEKQRLKQKLDETDKRADRWLELTEKTFNFALYAHNNFLHGDMQKKKEVFLGLGSNFRLKDGKLTLEHNRWFIPIKETCPPLQKEYLRLELDKTAPEDRNTEQQEAFEFIKNEIRRGRDSNPR